MGYTPPTDARTHTNAQTHSYLPTRYKRTRSARRQRVSCRRVPKEMGARARARYDPRRDATDARPLRYGRHVACAVSRYRLPGANRLHVSSARQTRRVECRSTSVCVTTLSARRPRREKVLRRWVHSGRPAAAQNAFVPNHPRNYLLASQWRCLPGGCRWSDVCSSTVVVWWCFSVSGTAVTAATDFGGQTYRSPARSGSVLAQNNTESVSTDVKDGSRRMYRDTVVARFPSIINNVILHFLSAYFVENVPYCDASGQSDFRSDFSFWMIEFISGSTSSEESLQESFWCFTVVRVFVLRNTISFYCISRKNLSFYFTVIVLVHRGTWTVVILANLFIIQYCVVFVGESYFT